jgi:GNAT superfamily N-acetyltransferase
MLKPWMIPGDLAPGDCKCLERDWSDVDLSRVESADDPGFDVAFGALWAEFGAKGEIEQASVLSKRLRWHGQLQENGYGLRYRLMLVTAGEKFVAVRDHTAIVPSDEDAAYVHLSHVLVSPDWRRTGVAGWLRALPIQTARHGLAALKKPETSPITLVAEMEYPDPAIAATAIRLGAYEKSGYLKVDPSRISYVQPDFGSPEQIDLAGGPKPLSLTLMLRRVGREAETQISGREVKSIVTALYKMYECTFRACDMAGIWKTLETYPADEEMIDLVPPTRGVQQ